MLSRRHFSGALSTALLQGVASHVFPAVKTAPARVRLGCQTNAWRIDANDFSQVLAVLGKLKELGYDGYETGFRNVQGQFANAATARRQLEATGLSFFATHIFLDQYDPQTQVAPMDLVQKVADGAVKLGAQRLILSGAGLLSAGKVDPDALQRKAAGLNAAGRYCKSAGLRLAYHNHGPEFENKGREIGGLYQNTDPALVEFVMDCGWAWSAGMDVPAFFTRHQQRIAGLHLREFKGGFKAENQAPLGQGDFPLQRLAAAIKKAKWNGWVLNEEERLSGEKPGESAVAPARDALRKAFGR
ncbi:MAG: sugar phosphate isomerase/epimerase family protein [Blastocatellia bacterium]